MAALAGTRESLARNVWRQRQRIDAEPEWMDGDVPFAAWLGCVRDLEQVNRVTRGYAPTLRFLRRAAARHGSGAPLRVLDIGFGGGGLLRAAALWGARAHVPLRLCGVDLHGHAAPAAAELTRKVIAAERSGNARRALAAIEYTHGAADALNGDCDAVVCSLVMHHLRDAEIVALLAWMERHARVGWHVNDLHRRALWAHGFGVLARAMRWSPLVRHDGPVSFRRSFRRRDWRQLLAAAGVPRESYKIAYTLPGRLCVERLR